MFNRRTLAILATFFFFGLFFRLYRLDEGLIFGYDQARDAYRSTEIATQGHLKILGPETDIPGIHHGVGYYYLLSIPYGLTQNPVAAAAFLAVLNASAVFLIHFTAYKFFQSRRIAAISAILFAVSFEMVQYSRWLSNPSLGVVMVLLAVLFMWEWIRGNRYAFIWAMASLAVSIHFQFFLSYLFFLPLALYFIYRPKLERRIFLAGLAVALLIDSSFIISEFKFHFQTVRAFSAFLSGQSQTYISVMDFLNRYFERFISVLYHTVIPINPVLAFLLFLLAAVIFIKNRKKTNQNPAVGFLLLWLFSSFPIFAFSSGAINSEFSFVGASVCFIFLTGFVIDYIWNLKRGAIWAGMILVFLVLANIRFNLIHAADGAYIFSVQRVMTYGLERKLIDYTYGEAKGAPFSICTLTNPLFINTTWAYLYENYAKRKYGYMPYWAGADQNGYLGNLPKDKLKPELRFMIYEPLIGISATPIELFSGFENYISDKTDEKKFGDFKVEKRKLLTSEGMKIKKSSFSPSANAQFETDAYLPYHCFN